MIADPPPASPARREVLWVLAAAAVIRVLFFLLFHRSPFFAAPILDSAYHRDLALAIAGGDWAAGAPYFRPPLYPWLLAAAHAFLGPGLWPGRLLGAAAGVSTAITVLISGGRLGLTRRVRVGAALAAALYAPELFLEGELLGEPVATALAAAGLALVLTAWRRAPEAGVKPWVGGSLLWALAALARAPLALLPAVAAVLSLTAPGPRLRRTAAVCLGAAAVWSGPAALMATHGAGFRFPATQGGINFYLGNHAGADGRGVDPGVLGAATGWPEFARASVREASVRSGRVLNSAEASSYWYGQGIRFWREKPGTAIGLTLSKGLYATHGFETPNNRSLYAARTDVPWMYAILWKIPGLFWPTGLLIPLAAAGAWTLRRRRAWRPVLTVVAAVLVPLMFFFVCARFRSPALPALVLLAAPGAAAVIARRRGALLVFAAVYIVANVPWAGAVREDPAREHLARAEASLNSGRLAEARRNYTDALAVDPGEGRAQLGLAVVAEREGDLDGALAAVRRAADKSPHRWDVEAVWAGVLDRLGRRREAATHLRRAVDLAPDRAALWGRLGLTLEVLGRDSKAAAALEESARRGSQQAEVWNSLGRYRLLQGNRPGARAAWNRALELDANHYKALVNRGLLCAQEGNGASARRDLEAAVAAAPDAEAARRARQALELVRSRLP